MLNKYMRVIYGDNGTLNDYSLNSQDDSLTVPMAFVASEDCVYIGKYYPFNNFFVQMGSTVNANAATIKVEYWNGSEWIEAVDILDGTSSGGKTLAKSGVVQFTTDIDEGWSYVDDTSENSSAVPTELNSVTIYDLYWIKITVSADMTADTAANKITYAFTKHERIAKLDHTINSYLTAFGLTDWTEKILTASEHTVDYLNRIGMARTESQILAFDDVSLATEYKTLSLIYSSLGKSFVEERDYYNKMFEACFSNTKMAVDQNNDGHLDREEYKTRQQLLVR